MTIRHDWLHTAMALAGRSRRRNRGDGVRAWRPVTISVALAPAVDGFQMKSKPQDIEL